jgi:hypothetical protein
MIFEFDTSDFGFSVVIKDLGILEVFHCCYGTRGVWF